MRIDVKSLSQRFNEVPEGKFPPEYYTPRVIRSVVFANYAYPVGLISHALFIVIFALMGITILALFNIGSVILWTAAILLHRKGYFWQGYSLVTIEIIAHAAVCAAVIGWDTGFQYYVFIQPACVFLSYWSTARKAVIAAIYSCAFAGMNYYANLSVPHTELNALYIAVLNYGNIFSVCSLLAYIAYLYYRATINAEEKLALRTEELRLANTKLHNAQKQISKYIDPHVAEKIFEGEFTAELSHRRTKLTMFFSDIKDFTQFTDSSDPEDVAKLLNEYLGEMARIVRIWGGTIPQFTGDSIYAIFGAPDSKGEREDALACARMAVDMQDRMKTLRDKWWNQGIQLPFEIRCGIHTGMANVGNYGSEGFMEYSAIGLNTNLASRLEQACQPGETYLSHTSWALVNDEIPCEEVGTIEVKGFHYPIQTYRVLQHDVEMAPES